MEAMSEMGIVFQSIQLRGLAMDYSTMVIMDLWGLWRSGKIAEALELFDAIKSRDLTKIVDELGDIAELFGLKGADLQLNELAAAIKAADFKKIKSLTKVVRESCDVIDLMADKFMPEPVPVITTMARKPIEEMTAEDCAVWMSDNKANVRKGAGTGMCRFALRRMPEVQAALEGKMTTAQLETLALDPDKVVTWLNRAIIILTAASIFYPPLGAVVVVLKLILARFESNNPDVGLPLTALAA